MSVNFETVAQDPDLVRGGETSHMAFFLVISGILLLLIISSSSKSSQPMTGKGSEQLRIKIIAEESARKRASHQQVDGTPALFKPLPQRSVRLSNSDAQVITRGLIIAEPWISMILCGEKIWEMRSTRTTVRGPIALIKKGTGTIVGVCRLDDTKGALDTEELGQHQQQHQVPPEIYETPDYKWRFAWVLSDVQPLPQPVPYVHKSGAVTWVKLDEEVRAYLARENTATNEPSIPTVETKESRSSRAGAITVPFARDGSHFCRRKCSLGGRYTVEGKHGSLQFEDYDEALDYMRNMAVARWVRPDYRGVWELVSADCWKTVRED